MGLVDVDAGWEPAVEAALGEAVGLVAVVDEGAARDALARLADRGTTGAIVALTRVPARGGSRPAAGEPVRGHVRARRATIGPLLDTPLGTAVAVAGDWGAA